MVFRLVPCSSYRPPQKLENKRLEPFRVAATLVEGNMAAGYPLVVVMEELLPLEGLMDTPTLGASPLELQEDPMVSHLQIPTVPRLLCLMDRDLLQVSRDLGLQMPLILFSVTQGPSLSFLWMCRQPSILLLASACISGIEVF